MNVLSITNIADIAELLSAFAAFLTVSLTFIELSSRSKAKKADLAMNIYSDFLRIEQQLVYAVANARSYDQNIERVSEAELAAFAQTHTVDRSFFLVIQKFTKESVSSFDCLSATGKEKSIAIFNFSGGVTDLLLYINTYLNAYAHSEHQDIEKIRESYQYIDATYQKLLPQIEEVGNILKNNLKKTHSKSNLYLAILIAATIILLLISFIR